MFAGSNTMRNFQSFLRSIPSAREGISFLDILPWAYQVFDCIFVLASAIGSGYRLSRDEQKERAYLVISNHPPIRQSPTAHTSKRGGMATSTR
jgi:hypothetical protein